MRSPHATTLPLVCLAAIYVVVLLADFFAPYDPTAQDREATSCPPTRIHWETPGRRTSWRPVVFGLEQPAGNSGCREEESPTAHPIQFLTRGVRYRVLGGWTSDRHLFGVAEPAHIFVMGTDSYGRDVFSRLLFGGQISLFAGLLATGLSLCLGVALGLLAGFHGGWSDAVIMRCVELFLALPWLYLLLSLRAFLPLHTSPRQAFLLLVVVIGLVGWAQPARLIRGVVLSVKERGSVLAARSFGASDLYLLRRHALPETRSIVLTQAAVLIPQYILAEVTLSFLGLGIGEPVPSWGNMLATLQQYHVLVSNWWMFFPGLALVLVFWSYGALSLAISEDRPG